MSLEQNKAIAGRLEEIVNSGDTGLVEEVFAEDFVLLRAGLGTSYAELAKMYLPADAPDAAPLRDVAGFKRGLTAIQTAFPDWVQTIEDQYADGDLVVNLIRVRGTHTESFLGYPGSGNSVDIEEVVVVRVSQERIASIWALGDELGFMSQLGAVSLPGVLVEPADGREVGSFPARSSAASGSVDGPYGVGESIDLGGNKALVRRKVEEVVGNGALDVADEVLAPNLVFSRPGLGKAFSALATAGGLSPGPSPDFEGLEGFKQGLGMLRAAFQDWDQSVISGGQVAEGEIVVTPIMTRGTHVGPLFGTAPTGARLEFEEVLITRVADGKVAEIWAMGDELAFLLQLGFVH